MAKEMTIIFLMVFMSYCHAQEDRRLPELTYLHAKRYTPPDTYDFYERSSDPLTLDARREVNKVTLVATNSTFYPYTLVVYFNKIRNLVPDPDSMRFVVVPGTQVLMNFRIFDVTSTFDLDFRVKKQLGDQAAKANLDHPYLLPIGKNRRVNLPKGYEDFPDKPGAIFLLKKGDTIFACRKGVVTALSSSDQQIDRLFSNSTEVRHQDGTILVYENINSSSFLNEAGHVIFPGQPIGVAIGTDVKVTLFEIRAGKPNAIRMFFHADDGIATPYHQLRDSSVAKHPASVIRMEMSKKEIRKNKE
jgi:hypothetical protein